MPDYAYTFCSDCKQMTPHVQKQAVFMCIRPHPDAEELFFEELQAKITELTGKPDERRGIGYVSGYCAALGDLGFWLMQRELDKRGQITGVGHELRGNHG